jgi:very-short-patch-repair endonuclease
MADEQWLRNRARELRTEQTDAEKVIWRELRGRRFGGFKFRRQHVIGAYVVDFYCAACRLVIEVDGDSHAGEDNEAADRVREADLEQRGLKLLRFWNTDVFDNLEGALEVIYEHCQKRLDRASESPSPQPSPPQSRGRGSEEGWEKSRARGSEERGEQSRGTVS